MPLRLKIRDPLVLFGVLFFLLFTPFAFSLTPSPSSQTGQAAIQQMEDTLFGIHYDQEPVENRLTRLEETVFGQKQAGQSIEARISRLKSALSPTSLGPLSPTPKAIGADTKNKQPNAMSGSKADSQAAPMQSVQNAAPGQNPANQNTVAQSVKPIAGETDYPVISQMEQKRFGKTYTQEDITLRLARLEQDVFKVPQKGGALADRVDNLRLVVLGDIESSPIPQVNAPSSVASGYPATYGYSVPVDPAASSGPQFGYPMPQVPSPYGYSGGYGSGIATTNPNYNYYPPSQSPASAYGGGSGYTLPQGGMHPAAYQPNAGQYPSGVNSQTMGQVSPDLMAAITESEKEIIGHTYPGEAVPARLDRLEGKVFHTTSPELPPEERMQRIIAVASAGSAPQSPKARAKSTFQTLLPVILTILPLILL